MLTAQVPAKGQSKALTVDGQTLQDQTVTVIEPVPGDWQVLHSTHTYEKPEAHTLRFAIPVPKEGAAKLVYRVRIRG